MKPQLTAVINFLKRCWLLLAVLIIAAAVVSSLFRALTPWATQYKTEVEEHITTLLGQSVTIERMETGWYWFEPVIKLHNVSVKNENNDIIQVKKLLVGINLFSSLWHWQLQPGILYIEDLRLSLRQKNHQWQIVGLENLSSPEMSFDYLSYRPLLVWIFNQQKIIIKNLSTHLFLQDGSTIPLKQLNLTVLNRSGKYRIKSDAFLAPGSTSFELLAEMNFDPYALKKSKGQVYFSVNQLQLTQWQQFFPDNPIKFQNGSGKLQLWLDWKAGRVDTVQSLVNLKQLSWRDTLTNTKQELPFLNANLIWKAIKDGWELRADHLRLNLGNISWPENKLILRSQNNGDYYVYIQHILLDSLIHFFPEDAPYPKLNEGSSKTQAIAAKAQYGGFWRQIQQLSRIKPQGSFENTQLYLKNHSLNYVLTEFSQLAWQGFAAIPKVSNLSGVLHWQPDEGRLELDSENTTIKPNDQPAVTFNELNASLNWKPAQSNGLYLTLDHLVLSHPDLLLSANGAIDELSAKTAGQINLNAQVSANNAQRWLVYLPSAHMKKKLDLWLKNNIKKVDSVVAEITVQGMTADFPYDTRPGEFKIKGHAHGADVIFTKDWPLTKDIDAYLQLDKRLLEIDITHANLQGTLVDNGNLRIADIGHDREVLLIHSKIETNAKKAQAYILSTPMNKKLSTLNMLQMQGGINLDLQLEAPLYPENDQVLVLGDLTFHNNTVIFNHILQNLEFDTVNGSLQFDQDGIKDSRLNAMIMDYPVTVTMQSLRQPSPRTQVKIKGKTTVDVLRQKLNWPIFSLMQGTLSLESWLVFTDEPSDFDHLSIKTSLLGMAILLPAPFGKTIAEKAPLSVDIDFNPQKAMRIQLNYNDELHADLRWAALAGKFQLEKGLVRLGNGPATAEKPGLRIVGTLPSFEPSVWYKAFTKLPPSSPDSAFMNNVKAMDILVKELKFSQQRYPDLRLEAVKLPKNEWTLKINQRDIAAQLRYTPQHNSISGTFSKLQIKPMVTKEAMVNSNNLSLKINNMPNLDLNINGFKWDNLDLGDINLKASNHGKIWQLDSYKMTTPYYQFSAKGQWTEERSKNLTTVQADLQISDLKKTLENWHISPVVTAQKGIVEFQGGWPGGFHDFSLAKVSGQMRINFKNGRITNLSPETEEKLGLGKLLSILSLQTIPRRLKLDFSDLSKDGYSFDEFNGTFKVANGLMSTQDSFIDGPIAYASMKGDLDIARQLYNLTLKVTPHVAASLPVVATIAGGPVVGFATWVVSKIINQSMQKISGYTYKISGPWKQPVVQQVSIIKKKKAN